MQGRHRSLATGIVLATVLIGSSPPVQALEPQLRSGSILCNSLDDLVRYQQVIGGANAATPGSAPDCRFILKDTEIRILRRDGPSRTKVAMAEEPTRTGWTNTYIPPVQ
jgi:hypothetical protein